LRHFVKKCVPEHWKKGERGMVSRIGSLVRYALILIGALVSLEASAVVAPPGGVGAVPVAPTNVKASFVLGYLKVNWGATAGATSYRVYLTPADSATALGKLVFSTTSTSMVLTPTQIQSVVCPVFCDLNHAGYRITVVAVNAYGTNYSLHAATPVSGSVLWTLPPGTPTQAQIDYMHINCVNQNAMLALLLAAGALVTIEIPGIDVVTAAGAAKAIVQLGAAGAGGTQVLLACVQ
jgi:hypothetical protein